MRTVHRPPEQLLATLPPIPGKQYPVVAVAVLPLILPNRCDTHIVYQLNFCFENGEEITMYKYKLKASIFKAQGGKPTGSALNWVFLSLQDGIQGQRGHRCIHTHMYICIKWCLTSHVLSDQLAYWQAQFVNRICRARTCSGLAGNLIGRPSGSKGSRGEFVRKWLHGTRCNKISSDSTLLAAPEAADKRQPNHNYEGYQDHQNGSERGAFSKAVLLAGSAALIGTAFHLWSEYLRVIESFARHH